MAKEYRIKIIGEGNLPESSACTLGISVGGHFHEGDKFRATVKWVSTNFNYCHIFVCDTLQRYNHKDFYLGDKERARQESRRQGDQWIKNNRLAFESFSIRYDVGRWDDWTAHERFPEYWETMQRLFKDCRPFREALEGDVSRFLNNNWSRLANDGVSYQIRFEGGLNYMLEELAVLAIISEEKSPVEIYAGPDSKGARLLKQERVKGTPLGLLNRSAIKIDFRGVASSQTLLNLVA